MGREAEAGRFPTSPIKPGIHREFKASLSLQSQTVCQKTKEGWKGNGDLKDSTDMIVICRPNTCKAGQQTRILTKGVCAHVYACARQCYASWVWGYSQDPEEEIRYSGTRIAAAMSSLRWVLGTEL